MPIRSRFACPRDLARLSDHCSAVRPTSFKRRSAGGKCWAAAGIVALTSHVERLAEDHDHAWFLAQKLSEIDGLRIDLDAVQTNMVFMETPEQSSTLLTSFLKERGILVSGRENFRIVTHLDITASDIHKVIDAVKDFFIQNPS